MCVVFLAITAVRAAAVDAGAKRKLRQSELLLKEAADSDGALTVCGVAEECSAVSEGIQIQISQISIIQKTNSAQSLKSDQKLIFTVREACAANTIRKEDKTTNRITKEPADKAAESGEVMPGDTVAVRGELALFEPAGNPGQFDARAYYHRRDTVCRLSGAELLEVHPGRRGWKARLWQIRSRLRNSCESILMRREARTVAAITLGEKAWMDSEVKARYQESGIAHIASVSGLHASLIGMSIYRLLRSCLAGIAVSAAGSAAVLMFYVMLTGCGVSAVRALLMYLIWLLAQVTGRKYDSRTAVSAAAILMLAKEPRYLWDTSFWLSFTAIAVIAWLLPELKQKKRSAGGRFADTAGKALISGFGIWMGMLPVTLYFFYQTPPWSILTNLLVIPLLPAVMGFGLAGAFGGLLCRPLGMFLAAPAHYLLRLFDWLCDLEGFLPGAVRVAGRPSAVAIVLYYAILAIGMKGKGRIPKKRRLVQAVCIVVCLSLMHSAGPAGLEILCLDVGQGDGALIRMPDGAVCMIDGGSSTGRRIWEQRIGQTVKYYGIDTIDYLLVSHADEDHISGAREFLTEYEPDYFGQNRHGITLRNLVLPPTADPTDFADLAVLAAEKNITVSRMERGGFLSGTRSKRWFAKKAKAEETWRLGCLAPDVKELSGDKNEDSMVLLLQYQNFRMLFTGDLEGEAEQKLTAAETDSLGMTGVDVLKVGHHGSKNASSEAFLAMLRPKAAVISCALENRYGHPAPETLFRLQAAGCGVYTTALAGAVQIRTDGSTFWIGQFLEGA